MLGLQRLCRQLYVFVFACKYLCIFGLLVLSTNLYGQLGISHYTYDSKDGLNASHIYGIVQDSEGTIWIGTSSGLLEFNGVRFKEVNLPGLKNIEVLQLKIDRDDTIWFVNLANQLCKYSREEGFKTIQIPDEIVHTEIWLTDSIVGVYTNLNYGKIYNKDDLSLIKTDNKFYLPCENGLITKGPDNDLLLHLDDSLHKIKIKDQKAKSIFQLFSFSKSKYLRVKSDIHLYKVVRNNTHYILEKENISTDHNVINSISEISDSLIHINTNIGVFAYDGDFKLLNHYHKGIDCTHSIIDNENNLWVTTMNNGLFFSHYSEIASVTHYEKSSISELHASDDFLWVGTQDGEITQLDKETTVKLHSHLPQNGPVRFIIENALHQIVIGQNNIVFLFENDNDQRLQSLLQDSITSRCIKKASFLGNKLIAIGTCGTTPIFDMQNKNTSLVHLKTSRVYSVFFEDIDSSLIVSTAKGLYKYDQNYDRKPFLSKILPNNITTIKIEKSSNGILWVVSNNSGIFGIHQNQIKYHFDKDHLLNTNHINDLFISENNELWISTTSGVNVIDSSYNNSSYITQKDGLLSNIVHKITHWKGEAYIGTSKGLNIFNYQKTFNNQTPPPIYLDQVVVDGEQNNLSELTGKEVNYRFKFRGINYSSLGEFEYKYRMNGLSEAWEVVTSDVEEIVYNKLPPNDYSFEIYAINEDGVESLKPATISFSVPEPFYQSWWFYLIALFLSIGLITTGFQIRLRQIKRKNKIAQEIRSHQLTALKAQMKPHFISNILNSIQSHSMLRDPLMVNSYITRLSSFVRKVLNMSDAETVSLQSELDVLKTYIELELLRSDQPFKYDIDIDPSINIRSYFIPPMLIQPYVENAIKHGMKGKADDHLKLSLKKNSTSQLVVSITDNGPGIHKSHANRLNHKDHLSLGTEINSDRINLLRLTYNQKFSVKTIDLKDTTNSPGTQVVLEIPNILK